MENKKNNINFFKKNFWKGFILTNSALKQITFLNKQNKKMLGIKINIKNSGCAGYKYKLEKVFIYNNKDFIFKYKKIKIYVSLKVMSFIDGTKIDYVQEGLNHTFKFYNPNIKNFCGCGESFNI